MFRTEITPKISTDEISLKTSLITMGSCFSDHIGRRLRDNKFDALINPFGVIFNPISINKLLLAANTKSTLDSGNWVKSQDVHLHHDVHSSLGSPDENQAITNISEAIAKTYQHLQKSKWLIITWGTAIVYERKDNGSIVANCHKVPTDQFTKRLLSVEEIVESFEATLQELPLDINVLLTVSPVRHLKETLELNNVSKSVLRIACHELASNYDNIQYFPAYELILDDLRDYRFYKSDMLHPSEEAIDYVWQKFSSAYFDNNTQAFLKKWSKISDGISHRPFNPQSEAHQKFIKSIIRSLSELNQERDVSDEITLLEQQLNKA